MPRAKIGDTHDPSLWTYTREDFPDGSGFIRFDNGCSVKFPPLPSPQRLQKAVDRMCEIQYDIRRRIALEKREEERKPK